MNNLTLIPFGLPGAIYRCPMPNAAFDYGLTTLQEIQMVNINKVITLVEEFEWWQRGNINLPLLYQQANVKMVHYPVQDFNVPTNLDTYLDAVHQALVWAKSGENIAIHCYAGIGRTGTFLTAMAVQLFGWNPLEAVLWVRQFIPGAVENEVQFQFVMQALQ